VLIKQQWNTLSKSKLSSSFKLRSRV